MIWLQPWMLWGAVAAGIPILIHLLNRLRYRTVRWGAMMFMRRITRSALRQSRLRHYLILACRTVALLAVALAMARPMVGGRLGSRLAGAPEAVLVLLDRSASMERVDPRTGLSRRAQALRRLAELPPELTRGSRVVLIDSAFREPVEVASLAALRELSLAGPTDTAADPAAMFEEALQWLERNRVGRAELWVVTDGQRSNWRPDSPAWVPLAARLAARTPALRIHLMRVSGRSDDNTAITLRDVRRVPGEAGAHEVVIELQRSAPAVEPVAAVRVIGGERTALPLAADRPRTEHVIRVSAAGAGVTWGWIELPADEQPRDNRAYFVIAAGARGVVWVRAEPAITLRVRAAFPEVRADSTGVRAWPEAGPAPDLGDASLVVWQGDPPAGPVAAALDEWVRDGGVLLALPSGDKPAPPMDAVPHLWEWGEETTLPESEPARTLRWERRVGPLADSADGVALPLAEAAVSRWKAGRLATDAPAVPLALLPEGEPILERASRGAGRLYRMSTLPLPEWSGWGDGRIWVPLLWRLREEGARRLEDARIGHCGEVVVSDVSQWQAIGAEDPRDPRLHAGIYRHGTRWWALNRPEEEDDPEELEVDGIRALLPGTRVHGFEDPATHGDLYSDAAPALLVGAALFLLAEAALALRDFAAATTPATPFGGRKAAA